MSRRTRLLTIRLDDDEYQALRSRADDSRVTISDYVRVKAGLSVRESPTPRPSVPLPTTTVPHVTERTGLTLGATLGTRSCAWCGISEPLGGSRFCSPGCERNFTIGGVRGPRSR